MLYQGRKMNNLKKIRDLAISTFIFYMLILIWITILKCNIEASVHGVRIFLEPMTVKERFIYATSYFAWHDGDIKSTTLNVLIFVPFGILVPILRKKLTPLSTTILAFFTTLAIESFQMIVAFGYFTYVDLICNTLGALLGIIIYALLIRRMEEDSKFKALIFCNFLAMAISIFATVNTILNFEIYL